MKVRVPTPVLTPPPAGGGRAVWWPLGVAAAGLGLLFLVNPDGQAFFPQCIFHKLTGLHCPGCGATRAVHQLLHGNIGAAFRYNALLVLALPWGGVRLGMFAWRRSRGDRDSLNFPVRGIWLALVVLVVFGVWRNLPAGAWLAP